MNDTATRHTWKFFRTGGFDQVRLDSGRDLLQLRQLDQKLWGALSCPVGDVAFDPATLRHLDADGDGHIRAPELLAALDWLGERLADPELLSGGRSSLPLAAFPDTETGRRLLAAARRVLATLDKAEAAEIGIADLADRARLYRADALNGDGVIPPTAAGDFAVLFETLIAAYGGSADRSGETGLGQTTFEQALADLNAAAEWRSQEPGGEAQAAPAAEALAALAAVRGKIDDFFARCALAGFDARSLDTLNGSTEAIAAIAGAELAAQGDALAALPIAQAAAAGLLPLRHGINPAWQAAMQAFVDQVVTPTLGPVDSLDAATWRTLLQAFDAHAAWRAARPATPAMDWLEAGDVPALALQDAARAAEVAALFAQEAALADEFAAFDELEKLLLLVRDTQTFANNFVALKSFYRPGEDERAAFIAGSLYIDGRELTLTVRVADVNKHAPLAHLARLYLLYCECRRQDDAGNVLTQVIAAAVTDGDSDQLMVGRHGVFYDRQGNHWDSTIVRIVDHPISLRQAFWAPFRKMSRVLGEQIQKFAANRAQAVDAKLQTVIEEGVKKATTQVSTPAVKAGTPPAPPPPPFDVAKFAGIFAAIGLAVGAIGTAVASVLTGFLALKWWQMPLAVGGLLLIISGPSMLIAWFKLRTRTLGPLLDANGWAMNSRALINIPFGASLTRLPRLPEGAERTLADPYAEKPTPWGRYTFLLALLGGIGYAAYRWLA